MQPDVRRRTRIIGPRYLRGITAAVVFLAVLAALLLFPGFIELRFFRMPAVEKTQTPDIKTTVEWAQEVLRTGHQLVSYLWVLGPIAIGFLAAVAYYFFTWAAEHREILRLMDKWQQTLARSEGLVLEAAEKLPSGVFVDFRDPAVGDRFRQVTSDLLADFSAEEIDIQVAGTAVLSPIPADVYIRLGNYFRYRAHEAWRQGKGDLRARDLWYAVRRYRRARLAAETEGGRRSTALLAHGSHGVAICLLQLKRPREALPFAREAAEYFDAELVTSEAVASLDTYGLALKRCGRFGDAVEAFERALARSPMDGSTRYNLACCYARWGQAEEHGERRTMYFRRALQALRDMAGGITLASGPIRVDIEHDEDFEALKQDDRLRQEFFEISGALKERLGWQMTGNRPT